MIVAEARKGRWEIACGVICEDGEVYVLCRGLWGATDRSKSGGLFHKDAVSEEVGSVSSF